MTQYDAPAGSMPTTGRWGQYEDHEKRTYRRVSTLVKKVETDTYHLDAWKERQVAEGMAVRDDLVLALKAMGRPPAAGWSRDQKRQIDQVVETAKQAAKVTDGATTGTAMHTLTERLDRGEDVDAITAGLPAVTAQGLRAYAGLRSMNSWLSLEIERTVVLDDLEVAGTFDRVDYLPELAPMLGPGECQYGADGCPTRGDHGSGLPVIVDVKTEKDPSRNGLHIGPQLAIYSRAKRMWLPPGGYVPARCVRQDVAVVVHIANGDAYPLLLNLAEGWQAATAAYEQLKRENRAKRELGSRGAWFAPLPSKRPSGLTTFLETAKAADYANPERPAAGEPVAHVAVRDSATGLVSFQPETAPAVEPWRDVVAAIWQARTMDALAVLWKMAGDRGIAWTGPVAMAGEARRRQIECAQRGLHSGNGTCACGWTTGQIA